MSYLLRDWCFGLTMTIAGSGDGREVTFKSTQGFWAIGEAVVDAVASRFPKTPLSPTKLMQLNKRRRSKTGRAGWHGQKTRPERGVCSAAAELEDEANVESEWENGRFRLTIFTTNTEKADEPKSSAFLYNFSILL